MRLFFLHLLGCVSFTTCSQTQNGYFATRHLWYQVPGTDFNQALAFGNGRLGGVIQGSDTERIILNEHSVWSGTFQDRINNASLAGFREVRELLVAGNVTDAGKVTLRDMSAIPVTNRAYSVTNDLYLDFGHSAGNWSNYQRWLDTLQGNTGVSYEYDNVTYTREIIANAPVGVVAIRLTASKESSLSVEVSMFRERGIIVHEADVKSRTIIQDIGGSAAGSIAFTSGLRLVANKGSSITSNGTSLKVSNASTVDLFYDTETEFTWSAAEKYRAVVLTKLQNAEIVGFDALKTQAICDHSSLMGRVSLDLGTPGDASSLPTNTRLSNFKADPDADNNLVALLFQFGRHLLISSARSTENGLGVPPNLQGLWNDRYSPPWGGKYTVNINLEMNYWPAEITNLVETLDPLWDLMHRSRDRGKDVAKRMYGCPGYVSHHNLDLWGDSAPHDNGTQWTMWPMSNLWLSTHMMEHYRFSGDKDFLRHQAWDLFYDAATFLDCYLFEFEGFTSSGPSCSPENAYLIPQGSRIYNSQEAVDISPTMDTSLLYEFYNNLLKIASILNVSVVEDSILSKAAKLRDRLRPHRIGGFGQIQEWRHDYIEVEPAHRHLSHLWDLFPGTRLTPLINQTLADAARVSLERRLAAGGAGTGWSRVWTAACFARLLDGDATLDHIRILLQKHAMMNLFNDIENWSVFQIDSNLGMVAAVAEMFLQSHAGVIHLLPALPSGFTSGSVSGLVARGGFIVSIVWANSKLVEAEILSRLGSTLDIRLADGTGFKVNGRLAGQTNTIPGGAYTITPA
ncbi:Six-hairpin glycosidase-like protein [Bisporella sp. PMI_857]|nr:Six-hairpin glycosidase-like protein [Bisporella sp. PMI_857]